MNSTTLYRCAICAAFFCSLAAPLPAQTVSHETQATQEQLAAWLHSGDPRLVAWAATLARERGDDAFIRLLPEWLKQTPLMRDYGYSPTREDARAYDAVLDALIRGNRDQTVEPSVLRELGRRYPIQVFVLLERLPSEQQLPVLKEWFSTNEFAGHSVLAELAALRLAKSPTPVPEFAAQILRGSEEQFTVEVYASWNGASGGWGKGKPCGDSLARSAEPGWPVVYLPFPEEWPSPTHGNTLIALGEKTVSYRWVEENSPGGSCNGLGGFDQDTRHAIVAYWLEQRESEMKWQLTNSVAVVWTGSADFDSAVGRLVRAEEDSFGSISDRLLSSGLLSKEEAAWARPKLVLHIVCHLKPCSIRGASTQDEPPLPLSF